MRCRTENSKNSLERETELNRKQNEWKVSDITFLVVIERLLSSCHGDFRDKTTTMAPKTNYTNQILLQETYFSQENSNRQRD